LTRPQWIEALPSGTGLTYDRRNITNVIVERAKQKKAQTRAAILFSASRLLRARGIQNTSVAEVMAGAKLTVGGFYAHFRSKEQLVDTVLGQAAEERAARLSAAGREPTERLLRLLDQYLTPEHRDRPAEGCPLPSTVPDVSRGSLALRRSLSRVIERLLEAAEVEPPSERQRALATLALAYGGLSLARAVRGLPLSDEILGACAAFGRGVLRPNDGSGAKAREQMQ
jgi:TetR/AcrR family transcriptional regulator, transcriptional repressor for nem operon